MNALLTPSPAHPVTPSSPASPLTVLLGALANVRQVLEFAHGVGEGLSASALASLLTGANYPQLVEAADALSRMDQGTESETMAKALRHALDQARLNLDLSVNYELADKHTADLTFTEITTQLAPWLKGDA